MNRTPYIAPEAQAEYFGMPAVGEVIDIAGVKAVVTSVTVRAPVKKKPAAKAKAKK